MIDKTDDVEDFNDSLIKCERINKILPIIGDNIKQLQALDKRYATDIDLRTAGWVLSMLVKLNVDEVPSGLPGYVNDYRDKLENALTHLGNFFSRLNDVQGLNEKQAVKLAQLASSISSTQELILYTISE